MAKRAVNLTIVGDKELKRKLDQLGARARGALLDAAQAGAAVIEADADRRAPGPHIITGNQQVDGGQASVEIGPDQDHWYYQFEETGATSHEIRAGRSARRAVWAPVGHINRADKTQLAEATSGARLAFMGDRGLIITRRVQHPGMAATPFLRPAARSKREEAKDAAGKVFRAEIDKLVESHGH